MLVIISIRRIRKSESDYLDITGKLSSGEVVYLILYSTNPIKKPPFSG